MSSKYSRQHYIDYVKLMTTAFVLDLEIEDEVIGMYVDSALQLLQPYIDTTKLITVPYSSCIDLKEFDYHNIVNIYRTQGYIGNTDANGLYGSTQDPMYVQTWAAFTGGGQMYNLQNYVMNYMSYNTLLQIRNTMSTPLNFKEDKRAEKLYVMNSNEAMDYITIEYIPIYRDVEELTSDFWIGKLKKLALAMTKIGLGRTRTRFTQSNAQWTQDGDKILQEGTEEFKEIMDKLDANNNLFTVLD